MKIVSGYLKRGRGYPVIDNFPVIARLPLATEAISKGLRNKGIATPAYGGLAMIVLCHCEVAFGNRSNLRRYERDNGIALLPKDMVGS